MSTLRSLVPPAFSSLRLNLVLYDHSPAHSSSILRALKSPTAEKGVGTHDLRTPEIFDETIAQGRLRGPQFLNGVADDDCLYVFRLKDGDVGDDFVGFISIFQGSSPPPSAPASDPTEPSSDSPSLPLPPDIGWALQEQYMGKGYATEAAGAVLRAVKASQDLSINDIVVFFSVADNFASKRVAARLGYEKVGRIWDRRRERWKEVWTEGAKEVGGLEGLVKDRREGQGVDFG